MLPTRMANLRLHSRASQVAILVFSVGATLLHSAPFFDSYAILVDPRFTQGCHDIKGIMAFSFLTWILRNTLRFERSRMPLTV
jgi:hypothetical protein